MGEEVRMTEYAGVSGGSGGEDERVSEWELGLPNSDDITPLSHQLIPPELASAFSISPEPYRSLTDVNRASENTISSIFGGQQDEDGSDPRKIRRIDSPEEAENADEASKGLKRPRLVWTPQLHKRFVDVVGYLGLKNAVPKTIMQLMNVEGLTRENVASHLQKYRLYLKRMSHDEGPSESESGGGGGHVAMPVVMHMPVIPGHGAYPWMQQQREAFGSVGSYHHHQHAGSSDK